MNMKIACLTALALSLFWSAAGAAEFTVRGQWLMGCGVGENSLAQRLKDDSGSRKARQEDDFAARQRLFLQLEAAVSETLSGNLHFHIGPQLWGVAAQGAAAGTEGTMVRVRQAYLDWQVPDGNLTFRMGLHIVKLPNAAGGSAVFDTRTAGVVAGWEPDEAATLSAFWLRPFNDNSDDGSSRANRLDNMDLFGLALQLQPAPGTTITPWAMYGIQGRDALRFRQSLSNSLMDGYPVVTLTPFLNRVEGGDGLNATRFFPTGRGYGNMFWFGLPVRKSISSWNAEFDFNYGHVQSMGDFEVLRRNNPADATRGSTRRRGWLAKALVEYRLPWGVPGVFGWYGSGDDGNVGNGSERLPSLCAYGSFTSYLGDGNEHWGPGPSFFDHSLSYAGSWGVGLQARDIPLSENIGQTFRVAYWGGTNSPRMVRYMNSASAWNSTFKRGDGPYLTTADGLLEINVVSRWQARENLSVNLEWGYVANFIDGDVWKKEYPGFGSYEKRDMWKAQLLVKYSF